jgi:dual specificity MAP kinase phosphatase
MSTADVFHRQMGCTADVPMPAAADVDMDPSAAPLDAQSRSAQSNPHAFSICVEAHENGDTPELSRLTYASHWLDSIEATALFELNSKEALRQLEEDEPIVDASGAIGEADLRGFLSLGPNGWSPSSPGRARKNSRRGQTPRSDADAAQPAAAQRTSVVPKPENIIHLECAASSSGFNAMGQEQAIESIVQLCQWIKKQAQPGQMASPVPSAAAAANASSLLAGAFRSSGHGPRSQSHGATPLLGSAPAQASHSPRRVLLHCGDGYTETSILALAYLMYSRDLSLPDAYLDLQLRCKRSFFVYARDMAFLKRVEARMVRERRALRLLQEQREEREAAIAAAAAATADAAAPRSALSKPSFSWGVGGASDEAGKRIGGLASRRSTSSRRGSSSSADVSGHALTEPSVWARGLAAASVLVGAAQGHQGGRKSSSMATDARTRTPTPRGARSPVMSPTKLTAAPASGDRRWFSDARFEGSFPSRILPFLYLGNLNHALNPAMLHALGITHVVSVGETALTPPASEFTMATDGDASPAALPAPPSLHNSLWHEERAGRISVLDLKNVSDDGIDPLRSTMREAVEYIEAARRSGGSVLVHCRVGVSRSSTIVLAYVMGHLDLNLVEAYLLVRSRRLNILIQPHLLFFWELRGWETYLAAQKAKRTHGGRRSENEEMADGTGASLLDSFSRLTPSDDAAMEVSTMSRIADRVSRPALPWRRATSAGDEAARGRSRSLGRRGLGHSGMLEAEAEEQHADLDMDLGLGAGSLHRAEPLAAELVAALPFGSGSPSSLSAASMRLTWGFLCREITALNERVSSMYGLVPSAAAADLASPLCSTSSSSGHSLPSSSHNLSSSQFPCISSSRLSRRSSPARFTTPSHTFLASSHEPAYSFSPSSLAPSHPLNRHAACASRPTHTHTHVLSYYPTISRPYTSPPSQHVHPAQRHTRSPWSTPSPCHAPHTRRRRASRRRRSGPCIILLLPLRPVSASMRAHL